MAWRGRNRDGWRGTARTAIVWAMSFASLSAHLERVWPMIEAAPGLFVVLVLACLGVSWAFVHALHQRAFKNKETEIAHRDAQLKLVERQRDDAEKKVAALEAAAKPIGSAEATETSIRLERNRSAAFSPQNS